MHSSLPTIDQSQHEHCLDPAVTIASLKLTIDAIKTPCRMHSLPVSRSHSTHIKIPKPVGQTKNGNQSFCKCQESHNAVPSCMQKDFAHCGALIGAPIAFSCSRSLLFPSMSSLTHSTAFANIVHLLGPADAASGMSSVRSAKPSLI